MASSSSNNKAKIQSAVLNIIKSKTYKKINVDNEVEEKRIRFSLKPTPEQYEQLKDLVKNSDNYYIESYIAAFVSDFEYTNDQILELSEITDNANISGRLLERLEDPNLDYLERVVEILKKFPNDISPFSTFDNLFDKYRDKCKTFEELNSLKEKLEKPLKELVVFEDEKTQERNRTEFSVSAITKLLRSACDLNIDIPKGFIFENSEVVPIDFLFKAYTDASDDPLSCERLKECIKKNCERKLRREFGPCAEMINVKIDWDLDSMILFNKMDESDYDEMDIDDCDRNSF